MKREARLIILALAVGAAITLAAIAVVTPDARANGLGILYVAPGGDCGGATPCYGNIQEAVDCAVEGDEIRVASGIYTEVFVRPRRDITTTGFVTQVVHISKTITIRGGYTTTNWTTSNPAIYTTTLDARGQGRVLYITGDVSPTIEGLLITGGSAKGMGGYGYGCNGNYCESDVGGGVYVYESAATLNGNIVVSNVADLGGGVGIYVSAAVLKGNRIESNSGGGLYLGHSGWSGASPTIISNIIISNTGGGVHLFNNNHATISDNIIISNTTQHNGGGLFMMWDSSTLTSNIISGNTAGGNGGGIYTSGANPRLSDNIVATNLAVGDGGGIYLDAYADVVMVNTVVIDNRAGGKGIGLYLSRHSQHLLHSTIARNIGGDGSGIYVAGDYLPNSNIALTNTILVSQPVGIVVTGGNTVTINGILWYNTPITVSQSPTATVYVENQHTGNPIFAADGYHLMVGSAAVDSGVDVGTTTDIDGEPRPAGAGYDLGADELWHKLYLPLIMRNH